MNCMINQLHHPALWCSCLHNMCETANRFKLKMHITTHRDGTVRSLSSISHITISILLRLIIQFLLLILSTFEMENTAEEQVRKIVTEVLAGGNRKCLLHPDR